jgi:hypothetical protein
VADIPRKTIEQSLRKKGFVLAQGQGDHDYYFFRHNGKDYKQVKAKISRGSGYKSYGDSLVAAMKKLLALDTNKEVRDLLNCPMDHQTYLEQLRTKGILD